MLARRTAAAGIIMLANDGTLPLSPTGMAVAVLGPGADDRRLLQGDYAGGRTSMTSALRP